MLKHKERAPLPPMDVKLRLQREEGERRRQEYLRRTGWHGSMRRRWMNDNDRKLV